MKQTTATNLHFPFSNFSYSLFLSYCLLMLLSGKGSCWRVTAKYHVREQGTTMWPDTRQCGPTHDNVARHTAMWPDTRQCGPTHDNVARHTTMWPDTRQCGRHTTMWPDTRQCGPTHDNVARHTTMWPDTRQCGPTHDNVARHDWLVFDDTTSLRHQRVCAMNCGHGLQQIVIISEIATFVAPTFVTSTTTVTAHQFCQNISTTCVNLTIFVNFCQLGGHQFYQQYQPLMSLQTRSLPLST